MEGKTVDLRQQQQQQKKQKHQHDPEVETLGDDYESRQKRSLLLLVLSAHNRSRSHRRRFTSADLLPLLADEQDMVKNSVFPGVTVRRESSVTEEFGGSGVLRFGTNQQQEGQQQQEQQHSEPVVVGSVSGSNGPGEVPAVTTSSGRASIRSVFFQRKGSLG